jgi:hypothetical protein
MPVPFSIACAIHDRQLARRHLLPSVEALAGDAPTTFFLDNSGNAVSSNMAHLCNLLVRLDGPAVRAIVHPDVSFPSDFVARVGQAIAELDRQGASWGALGAVGRSWEGEYVWGHAIGEPRPVCTVDACCLVVDTRHELAFDERTFDGFHCHVEDYCMQCHAAGLGVFVVPLQLEHASATFASQGSRWGDYPKYRERLAHKWRGRFPTLTTT